MKDSKQPKVAVVVPCFQEELTIGKVVRDFRRELPDAEIYVYDNNCTDRTAAVAREAGAIVRREKRQGKGYVVATLFEQVDADIIVMVDGDDTYEASKVHELIAPVANGEADMTSAVRLKQYDKRSFRPFHVMGNKMVCACINWMCKTKVQDVFSGFRAFSREAALAIPITAAGFDVETELTLQALYRGLVLKEIEAPYRERPAGSFSKLKTFSDGFKVILKMFLMLKSYKPLTFFGTLSGVSGLFGLLAGARPLYEFATEHRVLSIPSAVLAATLMVLAVFTFGLGLILHSINLRLLELEKVIIKRVAGRGGLRNL